MANLRVDSECLAALLDGRLDAQARAETLTRLASSKEDLAVFAEAAAVLADLEAEHGPAAALRSPDGPLRAVLGARGWFAMAAAIVCLAVVPWAWRRGHSDDLLPPAGYVILLAEPRGLPPGHDLRPWGVTRASADPLSPAARAVRLGATLAQLQLAVETRDSAAAALASDVVGLLDGMAGAAPTVAIYREVARRAGEPPGQMAPLLARGGEAAARAAGEAWVDLGGWAETARVAAARRDARFFRTQSTTEAIGRARRSPELSSSGDAALARVRAAVRSEPPDWVPLERSLADLLRQLAT